MAVMAILADGGIGDEPIPTTAKNVVFLLTLLFFWYCRYWYTFTDICIMHKNARYSRTD